ncbi:MAG: hypothetical protein NWQ13_03505, partial [Glaciimonas sp.]|nr:hypothetical protein [Glaciimonas sp.]
MSTQETTKAMSTKAMFQPFPMPAVKHGSSASFTSLVNTYDKPAALRPIDRHSVKKKRPAKAASQDSLSAWDRWNVGAFKSSTSGGMPIDETLINLQASFASSPEIENASGLEELQPHLLIDEAELTRLREEARLAGHNEGLKIGYLEGQKNGYAAGISLAEVEVEKLRDLLAALPLAMRYNDREIADDLLTLALDIGRQLV